MDLERDAGRGAGGAPWKTKLSPSTSRASVGCWEAGEHSSTGTVTIVRLRGLKKAGEVVVKRRDALGGVAV